jgi:hypothetical protein
MTLEFGNFDLTNNSTGGSDNNKLNIDLSNISSAGKKVIDGQWIKAQTALMSNVDLTNETGATAKTEVSVATILPDDNYCYELVVSWWLNATPPTNMGEVNIIRGGFTYYDTTGEGSYTYSMAAENYKISSNATLSIPSLGTTNLIVTSARKIILNIYNNSHGTMSDLTTVAYRRIGTNN